jgi:hypothetical protein
VPLTQRGSKHAAVHGDSVAPSWNVATYMAGAGGTVSNRDPLAATGPVSPLNVITYRCLVACTCR